MIFLVHKMILKFRKINPYAKTPTKSTNEAAGFDLYNAGNTVVINPGEIKPISIGIQIEIPKGYAGFIYARSGLGCNYGIVPSNCVGVIDSDYRGEIMVYLHNHSGNSYEVNREDKIAQLIISEVPDITMKEVDSLSETMRNTNGFESTGK